MKRLLATILACLLLASSFTGCSSNTEEVKEELKGAEISMFLTTLPQTIDPAAFYTSVDDIRIMGLIYEGLTTIDEKGKLEKALAKAWEYDFNPKTGNLELFISLESSRWSDGNAVSTEDFRFAWQRILRPENNNAYASLLYPILNAKAAKEGFCSIDDIGVVCQDNSVLMITFDKAYVNEDDFSKKQIKEKVESFMRRLSSPALVPLRQDVVDDDTHEWCEANGTSYVTNGPFKIKAWNSGEITFERSVNYRCVGDVDTNPVDKVVNPYKIINLYTDGGTAENNAKNYDEGKINFLNLNSASDKTVEKYAKNIKSESVDSTFCLFLDIANPNNDLFSNEKVRQALSMAIDRTAIAKSVNASPATGFVPAGVDDVNEKSDFRKKGGSLISVKGDIAGAKKLLAEAGVNPKGKIIAVDYSNRREDDAAIINACVKAWQQLGFSVKTKAVTQGYINSKRNGTYEIDKNNSQGNIVFATVLAVNVQSTTPDAYSILTSFSGEFGGGKLDLRADEIKFPGHVTGFNDAEYDKLCAEFVNAKNEKAETAAMHKAEEYLVSKMPAIPVVFNNSYYVFKDLSNFETDGYGRLVLTDLKLDTYSKKAEREALEAKKQGKVINRK